MQEIYMVNPSKDEKVITIANVFSKFLDESNRKSKKVWADKGS